MKRIRLEFSSLLSDDDSTLLRSTIIADPGYFVCSFRSTKIRTISQFLIFLDRFLAINYIGQDILRSSISSSNFLLID